MAIPTLKEAYRILGMTDPLKWEDDRARDNVKAGIPDLRRQTGTTTRLLVEACLDAMHGKKVVHVGHTPTDCTQHRQAVIRILGALGASLSLVDSNFQFVDQDKWARAQKQPDKHRFDVAYLDHYQGAGKDERPLPGPYGQIRSIEQDATNPDKWNAVDYDGDLLLTLNHQAARGIRKDHPDRVQLVPLPAALPGGMPIHAPVAAMASSHLDISNGMVLGDREKLFDGHKPEAGDLVLLTHQRDPADNGVYEVVGGGSNLTYLTPEPLSPDGTKLFVQEGDLHSDTMWVLDGQTWLQITGSQLGTTGVAAGYGTISGAYAIGSGSSLELESTKVSTYTDTNGDIIKKVRIPGGATLCYRNGLLESVEGAEEVDDPDDPSLLINILTH
jgi:hypothetical protein